MGERGVWGLRLNETDKVSYMQWCSPTGTGRTILDAVREHNDEHLAGTFFRLVDVNASVGDDDVVIEPTAADIERYAPWTDLGVSNCSTSDWYCLLRHAQGEVEPFIDGRIDHYYGSADFLADSLSCEWAFIINMDERTVEFYKGFNKLPTAAGRYAALQRERKGEYCGVRLVAAPSLDEVRRWTNDEIVTFLDSVESDGEQPELTAGTG